MLFRYEDAENLVMVTLEGASGDKETMLLREQTISKRYGWVFFYWRPEGAAALAISLPIFFARFKPEVLHVDAEVDSWLLDYESRLTANDLIRVPEFPPER